MSRRILRRLRDESLYYRAVAGASHTRIPYLGWTGHGNLGDEAMYLAHAEQMAPFRSFSVPQTTGSWATRRAITDRRIAGLALGGGTLVGNGYFLDVWEALARAAPNVPRVCVGVGVEDPSYLEGRRSSTPAALQRWLPRLREFAHIGVRGPVSQRVLADLGVDSVVTGDPALLISKPADLAATRIRAAAHPRVVLNLGLVDDAWGGLSAKAELEVELFQFVLAIREFAEVQLVATTKEDHVYLETLASRMPGVLRPPPLTLPGVLQALGGASVVVAEKLHAIVLAAALGVPGVALAYRPKCLDFQASVGRAEYCLRTNEVQAGHLVESVRYVLDNCQKQTQDLEGEVVKARERLHVGFELAKAQLAA